MGFPDGSDGKESTCNAGDLGSIPGLGRSPGGRHGQPLQYSCLKKPHGQRCLAGYSPWGRKESDTTEQLRTSTQPFYKTLPHFTAQLLNSMTGILRLMNLISQKQIMFNLDIKYISFHDLMLT